MKAMKQMMVALLGFVLSTNPAGRDVATCTNACGGQNVSCRNFTADCGGGSGSGAGGGLLEGVMGLNAYHDRVDFVTKNASRKNLGTITKDKQVDVDYPDVAKLKIYSFVPTQGAESGRKIEVLIASYELAGEFPANTPESVKTEIDKIKARTEDYTHLIKIYRRLQGERQWLELGDILSNKAPDALDSLQVNIAPNAMVRTSKAIGITNVDGERNVLPQAVIDFAAKE